MVGRRDIGSWLNGPGVSSATPSAPSSYPGERLGRPPTGRGSVGRPGRRIVGIAVDWIICLLIARTFLADLPPSVAPLIVLLVEHALLVGTAGGSVGHRVAGLRIETVAGERPSPPKALIRSVLLCLAVPALVWDSDQRGLHDKVAGTLVART
jgi:uncharacterized RDD family membrane protein YckC